MRISARSGTPSPPERGGFRGLRFGRAFFAPRTSARRPPGAPRGDFPPGRFTPGGGKERGIGKMSLALGFRRRISPHDFRPAFRMTPKNPVCAETKAPRPNRFGRGAFSIFLPGSQSSAGRSTVFPAGPTGGSAGCSSRSAASISSAGIAVKQLRIVSVGQTSKHLPQLIHLE